LVGKIVKDVSFRANYSVYKRFKKKIKKLEKNCTAAVNVLKKLQKGGLSEIPKTMRPHRLKGVYKNNWECHIKPDLLIIWFQIDKHQVIRLIRIGSHSELFQ
jgi:mRNA interferase YafQ